MKLRAKSLLFLIGFGSMIVGTLLATEAPEEPASSPKASHTAAEWFPKKPGVPLATAFPDIVAPKWELSSEKKYVNDFESRCPRLTGKIELILDKDDDLSRLLKAQLNQSCLELTKWRDLTAVGKFSFDVLRHYLDCLKTMTDAVSELYANDSKTQAAWLEEILVAAKEIERLSIARVDAGQDPPIAITMAGRHRLRVETALWNAKNSPKK